jgi:hypothetical protein
MHLFQGCNAILNDDTTIVHNLVFSAFPTSIGVVVRAFRASTNPALYEFSTIDQYCMRKILRFYLDDGG